jgi:hypothetical protein
MELTSSDSSLIMIPPVPQDQDQEDVVATTYEEKKSQQEEQEGMRHPIFPDIKSDAHHARTTPPSTSSTSSSTSSQDQQHEQEHVTLIQSTPPSSSAPPTQVAVLEARRDQIKHILSGNSSDLHQQDEDLKARRVQNREARVVLARQLNALHSSHQAREQRRVEVERELSGLQKQSLVSDIMFRKQVQADHRAQLESIESSELLLLHKLEAIDQERARRQAVKLASVQETHARFSPVLDLLGEDRDRAIERIEQLAARDTDSLDAALARELQSKLASAYRDWLEGSVVARRGLIRERFEVEAELQTRTTSLKHLPLLQARAGSEVPLVCGQDQQETERFEALMRTPKQPHHKDQQEDQDKQDDGSLGITSGTRGTATDTTTAGKLTHDKAEASLLDKALSMDWYHTDTAEPSRGDSHGDSSGAVAGAGADPYKNYSFKNTLQKARAMDSSVQESVELHNIRLKELQVCLSAI